MMNLRDSSKNFMMSQLVCTRLHGKCSLNQTKKNRDLSGKLKFTVKNSQYSYSIASPHRFFICKCCGQKFHHKKIRAAHKASCQKRKCEKQSDINKHSKKTKKKARKTRRVGNRTRKWFRGMTYHAILDVTSVRNHLLQNRCYTTIRGYVLMNVLFVQYARRNSKERTHYMHI